MLNDLEQSLLADVSGERLMRLVRLASHGIRLSGSADEKQVFLALKAELDALGYVTRLEEFPGYVSWPLTANVSVEDTGEVLGPCTTHALAVSTPPEGVTGEVLYLGRGDPAAYAAGRAAGRIVVLDGVAVPDLVVPADRAGCLGVVCLNDENLHQMVVSGVWGNPTPETELLLPRVPIVSLAADAGRRLLALAQQGPLRLRVQASVQTGWLRLPLLVADLEAPNHSQDFILLSGHVDSWFYGAMDNAAANATMVEAARLLAGHRYLWQRNLRLAFWSGHSHGRYCGSAWYADHYWQELYEHGVIHVNVDSTGGKGNDDLTAAPVMAETHDLAASAILEVSGQQIQGRRIGRAGDQSFWGIGLPSVLMSISYAGSEGGLGWFWHTEYDIVANVDEAGLVRDTRVYLLVLERLLFAAVLPFNYLRAAEEILEELRGLQTLAGEAFDLGPALALAGRLARKAEALQDAATAAAQTAASVTEPRPAALNACFRRLSRLLVPIGYTSAGPFDHSPALHTPPLPGLAAASQLAALPHGSPEAEMLSTRLVRERNRVCHALAEACEAIDQALT